jgi:hypothetical protein
VKRSGRVQLTVRDCMALLLATALGLTVTKSYYFPMHVHMGDWNGRFGAMIVRAVGYVSYMMSPVIICWTVALGFLGVASSTSLRRVMCRRGLAACCAGTVAFIGFGAFVVIEDVVLKGERFADYHSVAEFVQEANGAMGCAVLGCWTVIWPRGYSKTNESWADRLAHLVAMACFVNMILFRYVWLWR